MQTWTEQQQEIGKEIGREEGRQEGKEIGQLEATRDDVLRVLETKFGPIPEAVATRVLEMNDVTALGSLLVRAVTASSLEELGLR